MRIGRRTRVGGIVVAIALAGPLVGCGTTGGETQGPAAASTTSAASPASTTAPTATPTTTASPTTDDGPVDLEEVLPQLADLPEGWTQDPVGDEEDDELAGPDANCEEADPISLEHATDHALASFTQDASSTYLLAGVIAFGDETIADEGIDAYRAFVARCDGYLFDDDDPTSGVNLEQLEFPDLGDRTYASQFGASTSLSEFVVYTALTRVGARVAVISYGGISVQDLDLLEKLQRDMVDRL